MATYAARAKSIIDALIDGNATAQQQQNIAGSFIQANPNLYNPADPDNPTSEEKALVVVQAVRAWMKSVVRGAAERQERAALDAQVKAAGDAAAGEIT
jgi:hypothetical protein